MAGPLLAAVTPSRHLIDNNACDVQSLRCCLGAYRIKAVIPSTASRIVSHPLDRRAYKRYAAIERPFCRVKNWGNLATRSNRLARNHLAALVLIVVVAPWA